MGGCPASSETFSIFIYLCLVVEAPPAQSGVILVINGTNYLDNVLSTLVCRVNPKHFVRLRGRVHWFRFSILGHRVALKFSILGHQCNFPFFKFTFVVEAPPAQSGVLGAIAKNLLPIHFFATIRTVTKAA